MAESQLKIVCYCGEKPLIEVCDSPSEDTFYSCQTGKCPFLLTFKRGNVLLSIPDVNVFKCTIRNANHQIEEVELKSFYQKDKAWLEHKKKIPLLTIEEIMKRTEKVLEPFKTSFCRALVNSIAQGNVEVPMIRLLLGIEARHLIQSTLAICETKGDNIPLAAAITKYFEESNILVNEEHVESTWFSLMSLMKVKPTSINLMNILSDKLRKSQLWYYCIKDIALAYCNV